MEFAGQLDILINHLLADIPNIKDTAIAAWKSFDSYLTTREQALDALNNGAIVSVEYTNNSQLNQPRTSDFRAIVSWQATKTLMVTANLAAEIYNTLPAGAVVSRFRDAQVANEEPICLYPRWYQDRLSCGWLAAGYYQYMHDPALLTIPAGMVAPGTNICSSRGRYCVAGTEREHRHWTDQADTAIQIYRGQVSGCRDLGEPNGAGQGEQS